MAFKTNAAEKPSGIPANKKAAGFLNIYIATKGGGRRKLGAIVLRKAWDNEANLAAWLEEDPSRMTVLMSRLEMEYNAATPDEATGFDLSLPDDHPAAE